MVNNAKIIENIGCMHEIRKEKKCGYEKDCVLKIDVSL